MIFAGSHIDIDETMTEIECDEDMPSLSIDQVNI